MTWQSKEVAELVAAERLSVSPTERDRDRIREALRVRLEPSAVVKEVPLSAAAPPTLSATGFSWPKALLIGAGATVVAVAIGLALRDPAPALPAESVPAGIASAAIIGTVSETSAVLPASNSQQAVLPPVATELARESKPAPTLNRSIQRASDTLTQEIALIAQAEKDFHAGKLSSALGVVEEHRHRFPRGVMSQERRQLRIQILCRLGRVQEAESEQPLLGVAGQSRVPVCGTGSASRTP
jgi:hypothetical protein